MAQRAGGHIRRLTVGHFISWVLKELFGLSTGRESRVESTEKLLTSFIFSSPGYLDDLQSSGLSGDQADVPGVEIEAPG